MKYSFLAQDDYDVIHQMHSEDGKKLKDPITITINIEIERTRYNSVLNRYKVHVAEKIKDLFKPCK